MFERYSTGQTNAEILVFYGVGGIGKTKLLEELVSKTEEICEDTRKGREIYKLSVSFNAYDFNNPVNALMGIRKQLSINCDIFDYALLQYCAKTQHTAEEISRKLAGLDSPILPFVNELISLGMGTITIPLNILHKSIKLISDLNIKRKYEKEIASIEKYSEFEIYQRLPYYLGISILQAAQKGKKHILFIDSYESLLIRTSNSALTEDSEEWLKELFLASENILLVIACREKIKWYEDNIGWNQYLNQHIIGRLADEDSRYFLEQVPISDKKMLEAIVSLAKGVPLYLDMCVDIYEDAVNNYVDINAESFNVNENKIIERYIRHLKDKDKYAIKLLSVLDFFDLEYSGFLLKNENLPFDKQEIRVLFEKSIFVEIDTQEKVLKIDESVRQHIRVADLGENKYTVCLNMTAFIKNKLETDSVTAFKYFEQLFRLIIGDLKLFGQLTSELIEIIYSLVNMGFWCEIHNLVKPYCESTNEKIGTISLFAKLLYLMRTAKLNEAQQLFDKNQFNADILGGYYFFYMYLEIHVRHLSGNYDMALRQYSDLKSRIQMIKERIPASIYYIVNIKYIDLLFLKGNFRTALEMIDKLVTNNDIKIADKIEILRLKGHIFRFNFMLNDAAFIYNSSNELLVNNEYISLQGEILNNLVETYCYTNPKKALHYANDSIEINKQIDAKIELGKTYAAVGIAYAILGNFKEAQNYANLSISIQLETGYTAGLLFGKGSLFFAKYLDKCETGELDELLEEINSLISDIKVYSFLKLPISILVNDEVTIRKLGESCEWLDFEKTVYTIRKCFAGMGNE